MSEDFATFDLADVLAGKTYPRDVVSVWFNEELGFSIQKTQELLRATPDTHPDYKKLQKELDDLLELGKTQEFKVHIKGSDREQRAAILDSVLTDFPAETDFLGRSKRNPEADRAHAEKYWQLHIEKIVAPDGRVNIPDEATIKLFRGKAPDSAIDAVETAMNDLVKKTSEGFEQLKQDLSFFAEPSPEG